MVAGRAYGIPDGVWDSSRRIVLRGDMRFGVSVGRYRVLFLEWSCGTESCEVSSLDGASRLREDGAVTVYRSLVCLKIS